MEFALINAILKKDEKKTSSKNAITVLKQYGIDIKDYSHFDLMEKIMKERRARFSRGERLMFWLF